MIYANRCQVCQSCVYSKICVNSWWQNLYHLLFFFWTDPKKKYSCPFCHYVCRRPSELTKHMRVHTGEKPYSCPICSTCFARREDLYKHMRYRHKTDNPVELCRQANMLYWDRKNWNACLLLARHFVIKSFILFLQIRRKSIDVIFVILIATHLLSLQNTWESTLEKNLTHVPFVL